MDWNMVGAGIVGFVLYVIGFHVGEKKARSDAWAAGVGEWRGDGNGRPVWHWVRKDDDSFPQHPGSN